MQIFIKHAMNTLLGEEKELIYLDDLYLIFKVSPAHCNSTCDPHLCTTSLEIIYALHQIAITCIIVTQ